MEFMVRIEVSLPGDMPEASRAELIATAFYPWLHSEVTALAAHPLEAAGG